MAEKRIAQRSMAFVLAGGRGSRLKELTETCLIFWRESAYY